MSKRTLILGASANSERYAFKATTMLSEHGHDVFPVGLRAGKIGEQNILTDFPKIKNIDTISLYVGPKNQPVYYDYILNVITPKRIIFNPGTESEKLVNLAGKKGIQTEEACTLVLLSLGSY
ncbi:MAG: CoA-binding protein [Flavobacteriales bacterium]|nr:MAG: CoA-binding protein [Flavobacteriales bacterium]